MIVNDTEALARLHSSSNLSNRLKDLNGARPRAMSLFGIGGNNNGLKNDTIVVPTAKLVEKPVPADDNSNDAVKPSLDKLIDNAETQITLADAHNKAVSLLQNAVVTLAGKIDDIDADKLPSVINAASRVVNDIRKERNDAAKTNGNSRVNIILYTPIQRKLEEYSVIDV